MTSKIVAPSAEAPRKYRVVASDYSAAAADGIRAHPQPDRGVMVAYHARLSAGRQIVLNSKRSASRCFATSTAHQPEGSQVVVFSIEQAQVIGFLMLSAIVARTLVDTRLGIKPAVARMQSPKPGFHPHRNGRGARGDSLDARAPQRDLPGGRASGRIGGVRECERLGDTLMFAPEDYLAVLRFRIGAAADGLRVTVALSSNAINAVHEGQHVAVAQQASDLERIAGQLPLKSMWCWARGRLRSANCRQLRPGDQIVLPDGEDGWLAADNVRLRNGQIEFAGPQDQRRDQTERAAAMTPINPTLDAEVMVAAVISRTAMPARRDRRAAARRSARNRTRNRQSSRSSGSLSEPPLSRSPRSPRSRAA